MTTPRDQNLARTPPTASPYAMLAAYERPAEPWIALRHPGDTGTFVDGGWWPRSLDLIAELPPLLRAVEAAGYGEVWRVSYASTAWDPRPSRKGRMLNRVIKLGGFKSQDPAEIDLVDSSGWKRLIVVVVPPDTDPTVARRALRVAGLNGDRHRAREILDLAVVQHALSAHALESGCVDELAAASWDSEGGRVLACRRPTDRRAGLPR